MQKAPLGASRRPWRLTMVGPERYAEQLAELLDKQALYELACRLSRAFDRRDAELMSSCYHPDATLDYGPMTSSVADFIVRAAAAGTSRPLTQHRIANHLFEIDGDTA